MKIQPIVSSQTLSQAAAEFIAFGLSEEDKNDQFVAGASLSGDIPFELVSGKPAAFAFGVEYRLSLIHISEPTRPY